MIVTLIAAVSADGKIAQESGQSSLDWVSKEDTRFFVSKTKEIGTLVMGRKTFETIGRPLPGRRTIVMTSAADLPPSQGETEGGGRVEFTNESVTELASRLEREGVASLAVCGGASVYGQFLGAGLVNELFLTVEPALFGAGVPLTRDAGRVNLALVEVRPLGEQAVLLHYRVV